MLLLEKVLLKMFLYLIINEIVNMLLLADKYTFSIRQFKISIPQTNVLEDLNDEYIVPTFYEIELQKAEQKEFRIEIIINCILNGDF